MNMTTTPETLIGISIEWTGVHHSEHGDFQDISTHTVTYETEDTCYVTSAAKLVGEASYIYKKLDDQIALLIHRPIVYQGRSNVVLNAMLNFEKGTDYAVIAADGQPFAVAIGDMQEVATPPKPPIDE
jgi:hypothetical protein